MRVALFVVAMALVALSAVAAEPPRKTNRVVCAINAPVCARARVLADTTSVEAADRAARTVKVLWSIPVWLNIARVSESGDDLLVESLPFGGLPKNATAELVVMQIYRRGLLVREFKLGELLGEQQSVQRAIAIGAWGKALGSERSEVARYLLSDGRVVRVSLADGRAEYE